VRTCGQVPLGTWLGSKVSRGTPPGQGASSSSAEYRAVNLLAYGKRTFYAWAHAFNIHNNCQDAGPIRSHHMLDLLRTQISMFGNVQHWSRPVHACEQHACPTAGDARLGNALPCFKNRSKR
jgi:hypothetical protein